jgi:4'-phosphopantetheinyl transferase
VQRLVETLAPDECLRAERFHFERDRRRFIVGRGVLRTILGRYLGLEPNHLQFCYGPRGKPALAGISTRPNAWLCFNLAHSQNLALYAVTCERELGVDIECIHAIPDAEQIAARYFSAHENAGLRSLPANQKQEAFFNCWTRKEAYIKAIGDGLAQPLAEFDVALAPGEPARLLRIKDNAQAAARWSIQALTPAPGYVAALAVKGHDWQLKCWQWSS